MKRRLTLLLSATTLMIAIAAVAFQKKPGNLLLLDWAVKAPAEPVPLALLVELGLKDDNPADWSGRVVITGAKVVKREGYRFQDDDKLVDPDGWQASTNPPVPPNRNIPIARTRVWKATPVGIVYQLTDVQPGATLTLETKNPSQKTVVSLQDVLSGQSRSLWNGNAVVRRISASQPLVAANTEDDFPAAAYGPDGTLWVAYISYHKKQPDDTAQLAPSIKEQPANFKAYYTPEFGDQLFVKYQRNGKWSEPIAVTGPNEDLVRCAIAVEGDGTAWVAYCANRQGNYDPYVRPISGKYSPEAKANPAPKPGPEERLTKNPGSELTPAMCTDQSGKVWVACQSWNEAGVARIMVFGHADGKWAAGPVLLGKGAAANCWNPALAASPDGKIAVAYDVYEDGDYDIYLAVIQSGQVTKVTNQMIAGSPRFEARPSLAYDAQGRLWIAYEEGPAKWGKDYGRFDVGDGQPLYGAHQCRVVSFDFTTGKLVKLYAELPLSPNDPTALFTEGFSYLQYDAAPRYSYPKLGLDGKGRVWLSYRKKIPTAFGTQPGATFLSYAQRLDGDEWTVPVEIHHSGSLLDGRPSLLPHPSGGLLVIHNTDGRYTLPTTINNQVYASVVELPGDPAEPRTAQSELAIKPASQDDEEQANVKRIRDYRIETGGKKLHLLRGEFHRHTDISFDGGSDGSLEDMFRYAIDAVAFDWMGDGDHDNGAGREYGWWLCQKFTDAYHARGQGFLTMYTYERSVPYPHGHRNVMFVKRGIRPLQRLAEPNVDKQVAGFHADDTKMLYRYLKEHDGICASHTSATIMGTDWRDHDPQLEPFVEIYQGDRMSYEYENCPRAGFDPQSNKLPGNMGGWYPAGFINLAFAKGYRMGFQASSDHWSTHISFCIVLAERKDREAILAACKKRHCYGATDDIILDVRSGEYIMGDEFKTTRAPTLQMTVIGTKPIAKIDILKDSAVVETIQPGKQEYKGSWTDPKPTPGVHYYYVRVQQVDDELAWGSPMWIDYAK